MSLAYSSLAYSGVPLADWHQPSSIDAQLAATETTGVEDPTEPIAPTRAGSTARETAIMIVKIVRTSTIMIHGLRACTSQPWSRRSSHEFLSQSSPSPKDIPIDRKGEDHFAGTRLAASSTRLTALSFSISANTADMCSVRPSHSSTSTNALAPASEWVDLVCVRSGVRRFRQPPRSTDLPGSPIGS